MHQGRILNFFAILASCLIFCGIETNTEVMDEYRQILKETHALRQFDQSDFSSRIDRAFHDKDNVLWFISFNDLQRFNNGKITNELENLPQTERDSCQSYVLSEDQRIYYWGHHFLYEWNGSGFNKYPFPEHDRIWQAQNSGDKILCLGTLGYAVLHDSKFRYYRYKTTQEAVISTFSVGDYTPSLLSVPLYKFALGAEEELLAVDYTLFYKSIAYKVELQPKNWSKDQYLYVHSDQSLDSLLVASKEELNEIHSRGIASYPEFITIDEKSWIYLPYSRLIGVVDTDQKSFNKLDVDPGISIFTIANGYIIYELDQQFYLSNFSDFIIGKAPLCSLGITPDEIQKHNVHLHINGSTFQIGKNPVRSNQEYPYLMLRYEQEANQVRKLSIPALNQVYTNYSGTDLHPYLSFFGDYLAFSMQNPAAPKTHNVYLYNFRDESLCQLRIADESRELRTLSFDSDSGQLVVTSSSKLYLLYFQNLFQSIAKLPHSSEDRYDYDFFTFADESVLAKLELFRESNGSKLKNSIFSISKKRLQKVAETEGSWIISANTKSKVLALFSRGKHSKQLRFLDTKNGKEGLIADIKEGEKTYCKDDEYLLLAYDSYSRFKLTAEGIDSIRGELRAFNITFQHILEKFGIKPEILWEQISDGEYLGDGQVFYRQRSLSIDPDGSLTPYDITPVLRKSGYITKLRMDQKEKNILRIPAFIIDVFEDTISFQPNWNEVFISDNRTYVCCWEDRGAKVGFRISPLVNGEVQTTELDWRKDFNSQSIPYIRPNPHDGKYSVSIRDSRTLSYLWKNNWLSLDLTRFSNHQLDHNLLYEEEHLWLTTGDTIVKYFPDSDRAFIMGTREGIPQNKELVFLGKDKTLYVVGDHTLYAYNPNLTPPRLEIPWIELNGKRVKKDTKLVFSHKENNLVFPLEIPNAANPDNCQIEYRIKGLEKGWKMQPYRESLELLRNAQELTIWNCASIRRMVNRPICRISSFVSVHPGTLPGGLIFYTFL